MPYQLRSTTLSPPPPFFSPIPSLVRKVYASYTPPPPPPTPPHPPPRCVLRTRTPSDHFSWVRTAPPIALWMQSPLNVKLFLFVTRDKQNHVKETEILRKRTGFERIKVSGRVDEIIYFIHFKKTIEFQCIWKEYWVLFIIVLVPCNKSICLYNMWALSLFLWAQKGMNVFSTSYVIYERFLNVVRYLRGELGALRCHSRRLIPTASIPEFFFFFQNWLQDS